MATDVEKLKKKYEKLAKKLRDTEAKLLEVEEVRVLKDQLDAAQELRDAALYKVIEGGIKDRKFDLTYVSYDDSFDKSEDVLDQMLFGNEDQRLNAENTVLDEWFDDQRYQYREEALTEVLDEFDAEDLNGTEWSDMVGELIDERDESNPIKDLLRNTRSMLFRAHIGGLMFNSTTNEVKEHWQVDDDTDWDDEILILFWADPTVFWENWMTDNFKVRNFMVWHNGGPFQGDGEMSDTINQTIKVSRSEIRLDSQAPGYGVAQVWGWSGLGRHGEATVIPILDCKWTFEGTEHTDKDLHWWNCTTHNKTELGDADAAPLNPCELYGREGEKE